MRDALRALDEEERRPGSRASTAVRELHFGAMADCLWMKRFDLARQAIRQA